MPGINSSNFIALPELMPFLPFYSVALHFRMQVFNNSAGSDANECQ